MSVPSIRKPSRIHLQRGKNHSNSGTNLGENAPANLLHEISLVDSCRRSGCADLP